MMNVKICSMLIATTVLAVAQTNTDPKIADQVNELIEKQDAVMAKFMKEVRALPRDKQRDAYNKGYPSSKETIEGLTALIEKNPADPAILEAVSWLLKQGPTKPETFSVLEKHHLDRPELTKVILSLYGKFDPNTKAFLATVSEKSKVKDSRGAVLYIQAREMEGDPSKAEAFKAVVEKLNAEHPDLVVRGRRVATLLKVALEAKEKLVIGKPAPEILGKDVDGKEMKLSDYKGKVVVLDFWGDW